MNICVYCSSSEAVDKAYFDAAQDLGQAIGAGNHALVYGGSNVGLMGALAKSVRTAGGYILGVMPVVIADHGIGFDKVDELIVTDTMRERKRIMEERSDAFVALPGGFGTLDEFVEILTLKQLRYHTKPTVLLNIAGFYQPLLEFFEKLYSGHFAKSDSRDLYSVCASSSELMAYLDGYQEPHIDHKWF
ncbi:MAG: TIGR00730 family Rossman fold protein [Spirochaetales bacterium]|jgi:cytokinin riboside 5'-monophosphate phosphoribohydrolase|nr:TIGR00730 family Rossman fold protein [Spirochaetales bacterium]